ncbi:MAG: hypothetical protein GXO48_05755 [Chlorobi bacterium]|nr:hypothetical protein [Chlorobiota bacterium]
MKQIIWWLKREWWSEGGKTSLLAALLYPIIAMYIMHLIIKGNAMLWWSALFWLILLLSTMFAIGRWTLSDHSDKKFFYFLHIKPTHFFLARVAYATFQNIIIFFELVILLLLWRPLDFNLDQLAYWFIVNLLGTIAITFLFVVVELISSYTQGGTLMFAILGLPLSLPILASILPLSLHILETGQFNASEIVLPTALATMVFSIGILLVPYLWRQ